MFIIVAGALQGIVLSAVISTRIHSNKNANIWLSAFILCFALLTLSDVLDRTIDMHHNSALLHLFDWGVFLLGPFLLMYLREMTGERYQKRNAWFLHSLPAALLFLVFVVFSVMPSDEKIRIVLSDQREEANENPGFMALPVTVQIACYFSWGLIVLFRYSRRLKEQYSAIEKRNLNWLKMFIGINLLMWIVWIFALFTSSSIARILNDIGFPITAYLLGYASISQLDLSAVRAAILSGDGIADMNTNGGPEGNTKTEKTAGRYERSGLTPEKANALRQRLDQLMVRERPYLEDDLNLRELASRLKVLPYHLSQLLNEQYGKNFFDHINTYRAQEVENMLSDPNQKAEPILSIAFACGFSSKATFNSFFKKYTGQTPRQLRALCEPQQIHSE